VIELRRKARETGVSIENELTSTNGNQSRANTLASRTAASRSLAERRIDEELLTQKYVKTYDKLESIGSKLATDPASDGLSLMTEYVRLATPLVEGFRETPALFPCVLVGLLTLIQQSYSHQFSTLGLYPYSIIHTQPTSTLRLHYVEHQVWRIEYDCLTIWQA
jgi:hypothetical protein